MTKWKVRNYGLKSGTVCSRLEAELQYYSWGFFAVNTSKLFKFKATRAVSADQIKIFEFMIVIMNVNRPTRVFGDQNVGGDDQNGDSGCT